MNRERLEHQATISRTGITRVNGKTVDSPPAVVKAGVPCWAEGIDPRRRALMIGRGEHARYTLSWMDDWFKNEDLITVTIPRRGPSVVLGTFVLRGIQHDIQGGYWFGTLEERKQ